MCFHWSVCDLCCLDFGNDFDNRADSTVNKR